MKLNLSPISYWHEFIDMFFSFKVETGTVRVSPFVLRLQRQAGHHGNQPGTAYLQTPVNMTLRDHAWMLEDGRKPSKLAEQSPGGRINAVGLCVVFFAGGPEFNSQV